MANPYFNAAYYLATNLDVLAAGYTVETAEQHYLQYGAAEALSGANTARKPAPWFDIQFYLTSNPDLLANGIGADNAFWHFTTYGQFEQRSPANGLTVTDAKLKAYADANEDLRTAFGITDTANLTDAQKDALTSHFYQYGYAEDRAGSPFDTDTNPGETFTLTTGIDVVNGTSGDDTVLGDFTATATLNAGDQINGGAGSDTLKMYGTFATANMPVSIQNVETLAFASPNDVNINLTGWTKATTGIESVVLENASGLTAGRTITTNAGQDLSLATGPANVAAGNTWTWAAAATDTALNLNLNGFQGGTGVAANNVTITGAAAQTLNISSTGAANAIATLTGPVSVTKHVITGDKLVSYATAAADSAKVTSIDASATTGGVRVDVSAALTKAGFEFTGGSGNDRLVVADGQFAALTSGAQLKGGEGRDTLRIEETSGFTNAEYTKLNQTEGFEVLGLGAGQTVDASKLTADFAKNFSVDAGAAININNIATGTTVDVGTGGATLTVTGDVGVNSLTLNVGAATSTGLNLAGPTLLGLTSVAISSNGNGTGMNTLGTIVNSDSSTFTITGSNDLQIGLTGATAVGSIIDATGFSGDLVVGQLATVATPGIITAGDTVVQGNSGLGGSIKAGSADNVIVALVDNNAAADRNDVISLVADSGTDKVVVESVATAGFTAPTTGSLLSITEFQAGIDELYFSDASVAGGTIVNTSIGAAAATDIAAGLTVNAKGLITAGVGNADAFLASLVAGTPATAGSTYVYTDGTNSYVAIASDGGGAAGDWAVIKLTGFVAESGLTDTGAGLQIA